MNDPEPPKEFYIIFYTILLLIWGLIGWIVAFLAIWTFTTRGV